MNRTRLLVFLDYNPMKKLDFSVIALLALTSLTSACGSNGSASFEGKWSGRVELTENDCPFTPGIDINSFFPLAIVEPNEDDVEVTAANGLKAQGLQTHDDTFTVTSKTFSQEASVSPYVCTDSGSTLKFLDASGDSGGGNFTAASVEVRLQYDSCRFTDASGTATSITSCIAKYTGSAAKN